MDIEELYINRFRTAHNINLHLPLLRHLAMECDHITEFGTDVGFSTVAFLAARPKELVCYDLNMPALRGNPLWQEMRQSVPMGVNAYFKSTNTLEIEIEETDLLFIDTLHTYEQVKGELALHGGRARKFIALHDIVSFPEIVPAILVYLHDHPEWIIREWSIMQSGMAVLERREPIPLASWQEGTEPNLGEEIAVTVFDLPVDAEVSPS